LAAQALGRILASRAPADRYLDKAARELDDRDRRFLRELVLGSLRWLLRLEWVIERAASRPIGKIDAGVLATLRVAVYQLLFLDRVPAHAAVDQAVRDVRRHTPHAAGFANAVLRRVSERPNLEGWPVELEDPVARLAVEESHPQFLVRRWVERFGEARTRGLLAAGNRPKPMSLLCVEAVDGVAAELGETGVTTAFSRWAPNGLRLVSGDPRESSAFARGAFYIQDEASQAAALVPPPLPGERILDAAAAPGGKSFTLMVREPRIAVTAMDRSFSRCRRLLTNQKRLGLAGPVIVGDAASAPFGESFDRVIADLPCSGTGTLARHPELKWRLSKVEIERLAGEGLGMLAGLAQVVRPGGLLVVITCSLEREENDDVVSELLVREPGLSLVALEDRFEMPFAAAIAGRGKWQLLTDLDHDGFTVHVLERAR
jgi:16S rRNA (cytosine967-C5)-methyltransferase